MLLIAWSRLCLERQSLHVLWYAFGTLVVCLGLGSVHVIVDMPSPQQLLVHARLHHLAGLHHKDLVAALHRGQPVRHKHAGAPLGQLLRSNPFCSDCSTLALTQLQHRSSSPSSRFACECAPQNKSGCR